MNGPGNGAVPFRLIATTDAQNARWSDASR